MSHTIAVVADEKKGTWKVLVNHIKRGITLHDMTMANNAAIAVSETEACDHLYLAKIEA